MIGSSYSFSLRGRRGSLWIFPGILLAIGDWIDSPVCRTFVPFAMTGTMAAILTITVSVAIE